MSTGDTTPPPRFDRALLGGRATGIGSMPGQRPDESARIVVGETPLLPALPELPARGAGADMIGRTAALLEGLPVEVVPSGWRVVARPGADLRRARAWLRHDLDAFEEACALRDGPVKIQVVGPWTLAAGIELASGEALLRDHGARRDLVQVLAAAVTAHVGDVARRLPDGTPIVVQIDEPGIERVRRGQVPTASRWATYRSLDDAEVRQGVTALVAAAHRAGAGAIVHVCDDDPPIDLMLQTGIDGISFDLGRIGSGSLDTLAAAVESGVVLLPGVVDPLVDPLTERRTGPRPSVVLDTVGRVHRWWSAMGFASRPPAPSITVTPTCGLAGAQPQAARAVLERLGQAALALEEDPDGDHVVRS